MVAPENINDIYGENICKLEEVVNIDNKGNEQHLQIRRSKNCSYFMGIHSSRSAQYCDSCNILRRNLSVKLVRFNNTLQQDQPRMSIDISSKVNKRFLSDEERTEKENDQKRRRVNAEKRAKYWKFKAIEERNMRCLAHDDENDLMVMFKELDKGSTNDEGMFPDDPKMSMFWDMQRDVISKNDQKTRIRWHPL